ncbi:MAG: PorV/PorQ family protein, partial [Endomicrobiia bacterium]
MKNVYNKYFTNSTFLEGYKENVISKKFFITTFFFTILQVYLFVDNIMASNTTANFLKIGVGARAAGVGESFCAISDDVLSIYYNPAGLAQIDLFEVNLGYNKFIENIYYFSSGYNIPMSFKRKKKPNYDFNLGLGIFYLGMDEINSYDSGGQPLSSVTAADLSVSLSYSQRIIKYKDAIDMPDFKPGLFSGITLKVINKKLAEVSQSGFTADLGLLFVSKKIFFDGSFRTGISLQNFFGGLQFDKEIAPFPLNTKVGLAYRKDVMGNPLTTGIDFNLNPTFFSLGTEYSIMNIFAIRAGYKFAQETYVDQGFRVGLGMGSNNFRFDYAFSPVTVFGDTHKINITIKFGSMTKGINLASELIDRAYKRAMVFVNNGKYVSAYRELQYIVTLDPMHQQSKEEIVKIEELFKQVQQQRQKEKLEKEIQENLIKAKGYFEKGELLKAKEIFDVIIKLNPEHSEANMYKQRIDNIQKETMKQRVNVYFNEGMNLYEKGNYDRAIKRFEDILEIDPKHEKAKEYLTLSKQKQVEVAAKQKEVEKQKQAEKMYLEATNAFNQGKYATAVETFKKLMSIIPNYKDVATKLSQAEEKLKQQILANKEESAKLYTEGLKAYTSGDLKKAYELWKKSSNQ